MCKDCSPVGKDGTACEIANYNLSSFSSDDLLPWQYAFSKIQEVRLASCMPFLSYFHVIHDLCWCIVWKCIMYTLGIG